MGKEWYPPSALQRDPESDQGASRAVDDDDDDDSDSTSAPDEGRSYNFTKVFAPPADRTTLSAPPIIAALTSRGSDTNLHRSTRLSAESGSPSSLTDYTSNPLAYYPAPGQFFMTPACSPAARFVKIHGRSAVDLQAPALLHSAVGRRARVTKIHGLCDRLSLRSQLRSQVSTSDE